MNPIHLQSPPDLPMNLVMITVMTAVMTGVGTAATATFTSALTTSLWNTGTRLVRRTPDLALVETGQARSTP